MQSNKNIFALQNDLFEYKQQLDTFGIKYNYVMFVQRGCLDINRGLYYQIQPFINLKGYDNNDGINVFINEIKLLNSKIEEMYNWRQSRIDRLNLLDNRGYWGYKNFYFTRDFSSRTIKNILATLIDIETGKNIDERKDFIFYDYDDKNIGKYLKENESVLLNNKFSYIGLQKNYVRCDCIYINGILTYKVGAKKIIFIKDNKIVKKIVHSKNTNDLDMIKNVLYFNTNMTKSDFDSKYKIFFDSYSANISNNHTTNIKLNFLSKTEEIKLQKEIAITKQLIKNQTVNNIESKNNNKKNHNKNNTVEKDDIQFLQHNWLDRTGGRNSGNYSKGRIKDIKNFISNGMLEPTQIEIPMIDTYNKESITYVVLGTNKIFLQAQMDTIKDSIVQVISKNQQLKINVEFVCSAHHNLEDKIKTMESSIVAKYRDCLEMEISKKYGENKVEFKEIITTPAFSWQHKNTVQTMVEFFNNRKYSDKTEYVLCGFDTFAERAYRDVFFSRLHPAFELIRQNKNLTFLPTDAFELFKILDVMDTESLKLLLNIGGALRNVIYPIYFNDNLERIQDSPEQMLYKQAVIKAMEWENVAKGLWAINSYYRNLLKQKKYTEIDAENDTKETIYLSSFKKYIM